MELKRIFTNKKIIYIILLSLAVIVGVFLWLQFNSVSDKGYSLIEKIEYTKEIVNIARKNNPEEAHELLSGKLLQINAENTEVDYEGNIYYTTQGYMEEALTEQISQLEHVISYEEYLQGIIENSNSLTGISIFQNTDSFSSLNLEKTKNDYQSIQGTEASYGNYSAVTAVMNYEIVHYIIFLFMLIVVWSFFEDEKKGLKTIFYATKNGRFKMALQRIGVLGTSSIIYTFLSYMLLFLCSFTLYGGAEDLSNSIQSIESFKDCLFKVTVIQYLFIYVLVHAAITFAMSLFVWMNLLAFRNKLMSIGLLIIIIGGDTVLNFALINQSAVVFLKYENLYYFINPNDILNSYRNYMMFGHIVNCFNTFIITALLIIIICAAVCITVSVKRKPSAGSTKLETVLMRIIKKVNTIYQYIIAKMPILGMEIYKVMIVQKGVIFIGVWLYLLISAVDTTSVYYMGNSVLMQEIYDEYSGPVDERLLAYVTENSDSSSESISACVNSINKKLAYIDKLKEEKDIDAWFMYDKGYKILWTGDGLYLGAGYTAQETDAVFATILLILLLGTVFSYDKSCEMQNMIHATAGGRGKLFGKKIQMAAIVCFFICIVTYGIELYETNKIYPLTCLNAPVQSLDFMYDFPFEISIMAFLILTEIIHFVTLFAMSMIIYLFSLHLKGYYSVMVSFMILVVPSLIFMLGVRWCEYISFIQPVIYVEALQEHGFIYSTAIIAIELIIGVICYLITKKRFCR